MVGRRPIGLSPTNDYSKQVVHQPYAESNDVELPTDLHGIGNYKAKANLNGKSLTPLASVFSSTS